MWGGALSTFWKLLQPQLPRTLPLQHGVQLADCGGRGLLRTSHLPRLRPGIPRHLRLRLPGDLQRGRGRAGQPAGAVLRPGAPATLHLLLAHHVCHLPLRQARGQPRLLRRLPERQGGLGSAEGGPGVGVGGGLQGLSIWAGRLLRNPDDPALMAHGAKGGCCGFPSSCSWEPGSLTVLGTRPRVLVRSYPSYPCPGIRAQEGAVPSLLRAPLWHPIASRARDPPTPKVLRRGRTGSVWTWRALPPKAFPNSPLLLVPGVPTPPSFHQDGSCPQSPREAEAWLSLRLPLTHRPCPRLLCTNSPLPPPKAKAKAFFVGAGALGRRRQWGWGSGGPQLSLASEAEICRC